MILANIDDYRQLARKRLPRVLRNLLTLRTSTELLAENVTLPLTLAPMGIAGLNAHRGQVLHSP